jgi:hypothetical protein
MDAIERNGKFHSCMKIVNIHMVEFIYMANNIYVADFINWPNFINVIKVSSMHGHEHDFFFPCD